MYKHYLSKIMNSIVSYIFLYLLSFIGLWIGSGFVVESISVLAKSWKLPIFTVSFFLLGLLTSLPEIAIGTSAVIEQDNSIYVGNLLGAIIVLFMCVIPLLGLVSNGVTIPKFLDKKRFAFILLTVIYPFFATLDKKITIWEGVFSVLMYIALFTLFSFQHRSLLERIKDKLMFKKKKSKYLLIKIIIGVTILFLSGKSIVDSTVFFADYLQISPFFISLVIVAIGTNIPEIAIVFRSLKSKKTDIAFADYLGSASANSLLFGIFSIASGKTVELPNHFLHRFLFLGIGLLVFFFFAKSNKKLSWLECLLLFIAYLLFIGYELTTVVLS